MEESLKLLITECIRNNRYAQSRLYQLFAPKMFVVCQRYAKNREEAEDILQEGFVKVFEHLHQFKFAGSFEGWVRRIMVNCALLKYRSKVNLYPVINLDHSTGQFIENEDISSGLGLKELLVLIRKLPPVYRMVFNLYVFEGMKHKEIAARLGISEGTSKSNLSDARAILKKAIHKNMIYETKMLKNL